MSKKETLTASQLAGLGHFFVLLNGSAMPSSKKPEALNKLMEGIRAQGVPALDYSFTPVASSVVPNPELSVIDSVYFPDQRNSRRMHLTVHTSQGWTVQIEVKLESLYRGGFAEPLNTPEESLQHSWRVVEMLFRPMNSELIPLFIGYPSDWEEQGIRVRVRLGHLTSE